MFTALLQRMKKDEKGFTLIELLVVILIIGILAAIALPTFLGQKDKAKDSSAKSNVRNAVTQMESCLTGSDFSGCQSNPEVLNALGVTSATGAVEAGTAATSGGTADNETYKLTATSDTGNTFSIEKKSPGAFSRTCTFTGSAKGGCPSSGSNAGKW